MEQALSAKPKGVDNIFLGDLNTRLGEMCDKQKEELVTALADHGLEGITRNFTLWQWYM